MITVDMAYEVAVAHKVCVRPLIRRVIDQETGTESKVALPCGSTREDVCPSCADKARRLRMQQCAEGWHRTDEPERQPNRDPSFADTGEGEAGSEYSAAAGDRRVRSTRRRQDAADLPRVPVEDRTVGRTFESPDGKVYRPSMFLTLTLPSYGRVKPNGAPLDPARYDYRRAALDALHFPRLVDRFWQNLRRCAGYRVQYFAAVEPQKRLAPHLHAAVRGAIPRAVIRQVVSATYLQLWWPRFDRPMYVHRTPVWSGDGYCDPDTGLMLPTWHEALDQLDQADDPDDGRSGLGASHVMRFGRQLDLAGIIAPSEDADRAVRYLTKYLAKSVAGTFAHPGNADKLDDGDRFDADYVAHIDRLHAELRYLPCSEHCANWLRFGVQPKHPGPGLRPGECGSKAHDREHLGLGGRRVLVSRQWSGKTLREHRGDRAAVVREALLESGIVAPEIERLAASVTMPDGTPRYVWTDTLADPTTYAMVIKGSVVERSIWRAQYEPAKQARAAGQSRSATGSDPDVPDG
ncbi:hypothetical protein FHX74_003593 [Friedmanniella endophytica]|uniref:Replication initiation protein n=1 Tax=Microlunatus kandeliicorticis TaxID=1759536 RepID=A0A7W3IVE6_9ACTN|nr:replication initiator [Microlunatus kandeliicorticis]MBA8795952.1 hypothetical protein [Microlunatus kandeliicorticis]